MNRESIAAYLDTLSLAIKMPNVSRICTSDFAETFLRSSHHQEGSGCSLDSQDASVDMEL